MGAEKRIWTIGHSTHTIDVFLSLLQSFSITEVIDVRNFPGSKRFPHFNKEALEDELQKNRIKYIHLKDLGGRRKPLAHSHNTAWRHEAFRGYADYMEGGVFKNAMGQLEEIATKERVVYMCSEAVWWRCHRSLISDYLKVKGWTVMHIMSEGKATEHPFTKPARIVNEELRYDEENLFN